VSPAPETAHLPAPAAVRWLVEQLEAAGFETWAVGGAVRDELRGERSADWDFATKARPADVRRVFRRTVPVGIEHGTVGVLARDGVMYEVTTFRRDVETDGRHAVVAFADHLDDDLDRRDFTINAIAWHPITHRVYDPHGGRDDLERGVLRTVGEPRERFAEDWLRILRALRFAGRFELGIDADTWQAACDGAPKLVTLSPERVREELLKILSGPGRASAALDLYRSSGALDVVAPELAALDPDAWRATLAEVDAVPRHRPWLRVATLLSRCGEAPAPAASAVWVDPDPQGVQGLWSRDATTARGAARALALLTRLRASNAQLGLVSSLVAIGTEPPTLSSPREVRRWLSSIGVEPWRDLARLWLARCRAGTLDRTTVLEAITVVRQVLRAAPPLRVGDLPIDGRDLIRLGLRPGPEFGRILESLLELVLDDPALNEPDGLLVRAAELAGSGQAIPSASPDRGSAEGRQTRSEPT
jgi:tRNA nucleotidyltransferase (CCA-adding enzyme)